MKIVVVLALVAMAAAMPTKEVQPQTFIGRNPGKIVGGVEAAMHEFPFMLEIRQGGHWCGASLISENFAVTAAHCVGGSPSQYTLVAGDHNINVVEGNEQTRQVVQIIIHPSYDTPVDTENDIAILKVSAPFNFTPEVQPVILPDLNFAPTAVATVAGWGALTEGGSSPSVLMKVDVPYVEDAPCNASYATVNLVVTESMVCYGEGGKDSCQGDSGGPIVCGADKTLCGIVSWGRGCARPGFPGVYTETSYYREWIREVTTRHEEDSAPNIDVTTCGGQIDASSAAVNFNLGAAIPAGQRCVWTVKTPYDSLRIGIQQSGLRAEDKLYVTELTATGPGRQFELATVGEDFNVAGGLYLITLIAGPTVGAMGFSLQYFASGYLDGTPALSGYASLSDASGSYSYPVGGGNYANRENAAFILNPTDTGDRTLTFTRMDVENDSSCSYDAVAVFVWMNNMYTQLSRFCGTTIPAPFQIPGGLSLVTFTSDASVVNTGFSFSWA
ncbi:prostasin [Folsomia candida]|uniref:prostasin n=1 Tax=Folsomia candida TaxID=158441 RepID=UPI000B8F1B2A|nr:prostasin [Folsomia candida]